MILQRSVWSLTDLQRDCRGDSAEIEVVARDLVEGGASRRGHRRGPRERGHVGISVPGSPTNAAVPLLRWP